MWGGTRRPQHGVECEGAADRLGREDEEEHQVGRRPRIAELRQPGRRGRHGVRRHEQRSAARSEAARRSRRADGVPRNRRRVPVAAHAREARGRTRQRLAVSGRGLFPARRRQDALLREQSRRAVCRRHRRVPRQGKRRSRHRREADRHERRRRHLGVRHDGRGRHLSAQPGQLVAGHVGRPDFRQHVERPGRKPREHPVAARAVDHRGEQDDRQARVGGQLGRRSHSARPVVAARRSARSAAWCRSCRRRATDGRAATRRRPARSCGSSTRTPKRRSGRRRATS